jgi:hypothetical protein
MLALVTNKTHRVKRLDQVKKEVHSQRTTRIHPAQEIYQKDPVSHQLYIRAKRKRIPIIKILTNTYYKLQLSSRAVALKIVSKRWPVEAIKDQLNH